MMTAPTKNLYILFVGLTLVMCPWLVAVHYFWGSNPEARSPHHRENSDIETRSIGPIAKPPLGRSSYIISVRYNGQQSAGVRSMISQACWVGTSHLPMKLVEPFFFDSYVEVIQTNAVQGQATYMSDYFDTDHFKKALKKMGYAQLASWEEFIENAPRNVIYIKTQNADKWNMKDHGEPVKLLWDAGVAKHCYRPTVDHKMNYLLDKHKFCITRLMKILPTTIVPFTEDEVHDVIFKDWKPEDVTVIFEKWLGAWHVAPTFNSSSVCERSHEKGLKDALLPSRRLVEDALEYEKIFSDDGRPFKVAVMLRSEHMLRNLPPETMKENFTTCLSEIIEVTKKLQRQTHSPQVFLTSDIGRYGSTAFNTVHFSTFNLGRKEAFRMVEDTVSTLFRGEMTFTEWEDTFEEVTRGITDRGYIAGIQRMVASRADCIVLVGGGQFPKVGLLGYMENHRYQSPKEWCIHLVCIVGRHTAEYDDILRSANYI